MPKYTVTLSNTFVTKLRDAGLPEAKIEPLLLTFLEDRAIKDELFAFGEARSKSIEDASRQQLDSEVDAEARRLRDQLA